MGLLRWLFGIEKKTKTKFCDTKLLFLFFFLLFLSVYNIELLYTGPQKSHIKSDYMSFVNHMELMSNETLQGFLVWYTWYSIPCEMLQGPAAWQNFYRIFYGLRISFIYLFFIFSILCFQRPCRGFIQIWLYSSGKKWDIKCYMKWQVICFWRCLWST